jgi:two-component system, NtrC family, response regulator HydG
MDSNESEERVNADDLRDSVIQVVRSEWVGDPQSDPVGLSPSVGSGGRDVMAPTRKTFVSMITLLLQELPTFPVFQVLNTIGIEGGRDVVNMLGVGGEGADLATAFQQYLNVSDTSGFTQYLPPVLEIDLEKGRFDARIKMTQSVESDAYLAIPNREKLRVCALEAGYLSGVAGELIGRSVTFTEVSCKGEGADQCEFVGKFTDEVDQNRQEIIAANSVPLRPTIQSLLIGKTGLMDALRSRIAAVARTDVPVLIQGETGTGKDLIARSIHLISDRKQRPLITMNCGAIQEGLVEAELFGVQKGAYTGAEKTRMGKFQLAHEATLFFDEIGLLSMAVQGKLLRVLEDGCFDIVGGRTVQVDVRLIVATNIDLAEAVQRGEFREDLYFRLCTVILRAPPLRERMADVRALAEHFLEDAGKRHRKNFAGFTADAYRLLEGLHYSGNVRELRQMIEAAAIFGSDGESIDCELLAAGGHVPMSRNIESDEALATIDDVARSILESGISLKELEKVCVDQALNNSGGNLAQAARLLGVSRRQIEYRVRGS